MFSTLQEEYQSRKLIIRFDNTCLLTCLSKLRALFSGNGDSFDNPVDRETQNVNDSRSQHRKLDLAETIGSHCH